MGKKKPKREITGEIIIHRVYDPERRERLLDWFRNFLSKPVEKVEKTDDPDKEAA